MADLNSYEEVLQLGEDLEYPEGYNVVEIIGTGDERTIRSFPNLVLSGPVSLSSNGTTVATLTCIITDVSADNPFYLDPITNEEVTPSSDSNGAYITTAYWMSSKPRLFEDEAHTIEVPPEAIAWRQNTIRILESAGWTQTNPPPGWSGWGIHTPIPFYVAYDGQYSLTVSDGDQAGEEWWLYSKEELAAREAARDPAEDVAGVIYTDLAATEECESGTIGIPNRPGQEAIVSFYYRPEAGDSGIAYLNVELNGGFSTWPINVTMGSYEGCTISLDPDPGSIKPIYGTSVITATAADRDGYPINNALFTFSIQSGSGSFSPASGTLEAKIDVDEEIISSSTTEFSTAHPIIRIHSIEAAGGGFTWNNQAVFRGSSVVLKDQTFAQNETALKVNYDWGGQITTEYTAKGTADGDKVYISGTMGGGVNGLCSVDISDGASLGDGDLSISADPTDIAKLATSAVTCICTDADGVGVDAAKIKFTLVPNKGKLEMAAKNDPISNEDASISNKKTCSVNYPIASVSSILFQAVAYTVFEISGSTIVVNEDFGVVSGTAVVSYVPMGINIGTYTAIDEDYNVSVNASYLGMTDTCSIKVGTGDPINTADAELSIEASPISLKVGEECTISVSLVNLTNPVAGATIDFIVASGFGTLSQNTAITDSSGVAQVTLTAKSAGTKRINAGFGELTVSCSVAFTAAEVEGGVEATLDLPPVYIVGWVDPVTKKYELTNGATIDDWGAAKDCDSFGCTNEDVPNLGWKGYLKILNTKNDALAWDIVGAPKVSGSGTLESNIGGLGSSMQKLDPFFYDTLVIGVPWPMALNSNRTQNITISDKDNQGTGVSGATVTLAGQTSTTDSNGKASFMDLPVGEHNLDIKHPNYKDNRLGVVGGTGAFDDDANNDKYTVVDYSNKKFSLSKVEINISIIYTVKWNQFYIGYGPGTSYGPPESYAPGTVFHQYTAGPSAKYGPPTENWSDRSVLNALAAARNNK